MDSNLLIIDNILTSTTTTVRNSAISNDGKNCSKFHVDMEENNGFHSVRESNDKQGSSNEIYKDQSNQSEINSESEIKENENTNSSDKSLNRLKSQESDNSSEVCIKRGRKNSEDEQANNKINLNNIETFIFGNELVKELIDRNKVSSIEGNIDIKLLKDLKQNVVSGEKSMLQKNNDTNNSVLHDIKTIGDNFEANNLQKINNLEILILENDKSKNASIENKSGFDIMQIQTGSDSYIAENYTLENTKDVNLVQNSSTNDVTTVDIGKQVFESIQNHISQQSDEKQITVRLNPPELGQVCIKFQEQNNEITGLLEVSKIQTRAEIEQALPQIIRDLNHSGIDIKRLEVVLTGGDRQNDAAKDGSMFYDGSQNQNFSDSDLQERHNNSFGYNDWLTKNIEYEINSIMQELFTAQNSINMLV